MREWVRIGRYAAIYTPRRVIRPLLGAIWMILKADPSRAMEAIRDVHEILDERTIVLELRDILALAEHYTSAAMDHALAAGVSLLERPIR